jgi:hypothetical protein
MAEFAPPLYVRPAVMIEVAAGAFNTIVEALALRFAELGRRLVPSAVLALLAKARPSWPLGGEGRAVCRCASGENCRT